MVQIHDVNAAEQRCTSRIVNVKKEIENRVETLDAKVSEFRDEHEKKLNELQSSNNDQVEIIKKTLTTPLTSHDKSIEYQYQNKKSSDQADGPFSHFCTWHSSNIY